MRDEALEALWEVREGEMAEEEAFEKRRALLREYVEWIKGLPEEAVLWWFREDGGDPEVEAEEARQMMLDSLVRD